MACRRGPGWIMTKLERQRSLRHAAIAGKPTRKPIIADRIDLWLSTGRQIDGLWVGTTEDKPRPGLRRVEDALQLIKQHSPLHYCRVIHNLERVWVRLVPAANAWLPWAAHRLRTRRTICSSGNNDTRGNCFRNRSRSHPCTAGAIGDRLR
jgi:hypothetical protein